MSTWISRFFIAGNPVTQTAQALFSAFLQTICKSHRSVLLLPLESLNLPNDNGFSEQSHWNKCCIWTDEVWKLSQRSCGRCSYWARSLAGQLWIAHELCCAVCWSWAWRWHFGKDERPIQWPTTPRRAVNREIIPLLPISGYDQEWFFFQASTTLGSGGAEKRGFWGEVERVVFPKLDVEGREQVCTFASLQK